MTPAVRLRVAHVALVLLAAAYVVQLVRPLHLEPDSVCYLLTAEKVAQGQGYGCPGCPKQHCSIVFPPGYPAMLSALIRTGWATAWSFVIVNLLFLALGLVAAYGLCRRSFGLGPDGSFAVCGLTLLSYPVFRYVNTPLSDFLFLGLALLSVLALVAAAALQGWTRAGAIAAGAILAGFAILTRTIGVALIPAIFWACLGGSSAPARLRALLRGPSRAVVIGVGVGALLAVGCAAFVWLRHSDYVRGLGAQYGRGLGGTLLRAWGYRVTELGELFANAPAAKLPAPLHVFISALGAVGVMVLAYCAWSKRADAGPAEVFALTYAMILFVWPFADVRFWIPILPLLAAWVFWLLRRGGLSRPVRLAVAGYAALFCLTGVVGIGYNTRISFSGRRFPGFFHDRYLAPVYRVAWEEPEPGDSVAADSAALRVLRAYEPRLRTLGSGHGW